MQTAQNRVCLRGRVAAGPAFSHTSHGVAYHMFSLAARRLSGAEDVVRVLASAPLLAQCPCAEGQTVAVEGSLRSFNNKSTQGSRLVITVLARTLTPGEGPDENQIFLSGALCKPPVYRATPLGREICDLILAVNRSYGRADYLPCIVWGAGARQCEACAVGSRLALEGRLQSRAYIKLVDGVQTHRVAYEVSVSQVTAPEPDEPAPKNFAPPRILS
ncbi:MAG: single-stranded DNA-binding protein [Oscillospiraceae bacterium]|jgi:single-stranded DNA-binding protein|nr:single-stranded DNA-binding protein [Oscillospiraceae bacterium]